MKRLILALTAAIRAFRNVWLSSPNFVINTGKAAWDNGTDYDIPTFLRRTAV
jgi:hypothetical protein